MMGILTPKPKPDEEEAWDEDPELEERERVMAWQFGHFLRLKFNPQDAADLMTGGADYHAAADLLNRGASHAVVKRILL